MSVQEIQTYNNQRIITINKASCGNGFLYAQFNMQALHNAMKTLHTVGGIELYLYIAKNQPLEKYALSSKHFMEITGLSIKAYNNGFKELLDKGFLVANEKNSDNSKNTYYTFNEWGNITYTIDYDNGRNKEKVDDGKFNF